MALHVTAQRLGKGLLALSIVLCAAVLFQSSSPYVGYVNTTGISKSSNVMNFDWTNSTDFNFMKQLYKSLDGALNLQEINKDRTKKAVEYNTTLRNMVTHVIWPREIEQQFNFQALYPELQMRFRSIVSGREKRSPNAIIIGVKKGGTRALLDFLMLHSQVSLPSKEQHFFTDNRHLDSQHFTKTMSTYKKNMSYSFPDQITMEKTPAYIRFPLAARRVAQNLPKVKLIVTFRNPVSRLISDYAHEQNGRYKHGPDFHHAVFDDDGAVRSNAYIVKNSLYDEQISHWLEHLPRDQFHFIKSEDLYTDTVGVLRGIETFLGLRHELDETVMFRDDSGHVCYIDDDLLKGRFCLAENKHLAHPDVSEEDVVKLTQYYKPHMDKFYDIIGQNMNLL